MNNKVLTSQGAGQMLWVKNSIIEGTDYGVEWSQQTGGNVIHSYTLGSSQPSAEVEQAIDYAREHNQLVYAASGNNGMNNISSPADAPWANAVGAIGHNDELALFSNYG